MVYYTSLRCKMPGIVQQALSFLSDSKHAARLGGMFFCASSRRECAVQAFWANGTNSFSLNILCCLHSTSTFFLPAAVPRRFPVYSRRILR